MNSGDRLNKFLAGCGIGSRRACDRWIKEGKVEVNGKPCLELSTRIGPNDHVRFEGRRMVPKEISTIAFHKPRGLVCTREDELGRDTIYSLIPPALHGLHHVGRLDLDSEGLLILTNNGDLTQSLMHPSNEVEKEYFVTSNQPFENAHLDQFLTGIYTTNQVKLRAKAIDRMSPRRLRIVLGHGAKRQIRVMFEALGYRVTKLVRVRIGSLWLGELPPGRHAVLNEAEIAMLTRNPSPAKAAGAAGVSGAKPKPTSARRDGATTRRPAAKKSARKRF